MSVTYCIIKNSCELYLNIPKTCAVYSYSKLWRALVTEIRLSDAILLCCVTFCIRIHKLQTQLLLFASIALCYVKSMFHVVCRRLPGSILVEDVLLYQDTRWLRKTILMETFRSPNVGYRLRRKIEITQIN